jgi:hypothetical protein
MDFFTVPTVTFQVLYILIFIHHARRRILHFNVSAYPGTEWIIQQLREAFPYDTAPRYLIFDRHGKFGQSVVTAMKAMGIKPSRTAFRSPWQNGVVDVTYYHADRTHLGLQKDSPFGRPTIPKPGPNANLVSLPRVGGLHHQYEWRDAA